MGTLCVYVCAFLSLVPKRVPRRTSWPQKALRVLFVCLFLETYRVRAEKASVWEKPKVAGDS